MLEVVLSAAIVIGAISVAFYVLRMRTQAYMQKSRKALEEQERRLRSRLGNSV